MQNIVRLLKGRILTCLNLEASRQNLKENKSLLANGGHEIWKKTNRGMTHCVYFHSLWDAVLLPADWCRFLAIFLGPGKARQVGQDLVQRERNTEH